jgi:hypothetical protein
MRVFDLIGKAPQTESRVAVAHGVTARSRTQQVTRAVDLGAKRSEAVGLAVPARRATCPID